MSRRLLGTAAAVLAAGLAAGALLWPDRETGRPELQLRGANIALRGDERPADVGRDLDRLRGARADLVRVPLDWSLLEQSGKGTQLTRSRRYVELVDRLLTDARSRGLRVVAALTGTPCWASSAPEERRRGCRGDWRARHRLVETWAPRDPEDYADVAAWVAHRWGGARPGRPRLHALEVWNEPNAPRFLKARGDGSTSSPLPAAGEYARMIEAAYPRIKRVAPELTVLGGSLSGADGGFLERLYDLGAGRSLDAVSYHPYTDGDDPRLLGQPDRRRTSYRRGTEWLREIMVSRGQAELRLWITEVGFSSCTAPLARRATGGGGDCVTLAEQARYTRALFDLARGWPYVHAVLVYELRDRTGDGTREGEFGLLGRDGRPKPAWAAFRAALAPR